jgi:hypothetical protein
MWQTAVAFLGSNIVQSTNVRMIQLGDGFRFSLESLPASHISRKLRRQNLDGYCSLEASIPRTIHLSHSACAERCRDFIRAKLCAWGQGHSWRDYSPRMVPLILSLVGQA